MAVQRITRSRLWTPKDLEISPVLWVDCDKCKAAEDSSGIAAIYAEDGQLLRPLSGYTYHYWPTMKNGRRWLGANPDDSSLPYRMGMGTYTSSGAFQGASGVTAVGTYWRHTASNTYQTFWSINNVSEDGNTAATQAAQAMLTLKPYNNLTHIQWQARRITADTHAVQTVNAGLSAGGLTCSERLDAKNAKFSLHIGNQWYGLSDISGVSSGVLRGCSNSAYQIMIGFQRDNVSGSNQTSLGEAIFYNEALSDEDLAKIEGYQAHKWGTQDSLPVAHPYKANPPLVTWVEDIDILEPNAENFYIYTAKKGDTWDFIAFKQYYNESEQTRLRAANPTLASVVVFDGGEEIRVPTVSDSILRGAAENAMAENPAPWLQ